MSYIYSNHLCQDNIMEGYLLIMPSHDGLSAKCPPIRVLQNICKTPLANLVT